MKATIDTTNKTICLEEAMTIKEFLDFLESIDNILRDDDYKIIPKTEYQYYPIYNPPFTLPGTLCQPYVITQV